ncbi:distal tail protein Dit [Gracilibacillus saliphilus]|uniref:distal tail protein Dit n=1 Tax=Gracilibacillus saliphilus TaxID=543890 RepID=UPI0013D513A5|nr:distal tail protein Dit [Gracilibacillus saliphilus]
MYNFVDTVPSSVNNDHLSLQTIFNGYNLDEGLTDDTGSFVTLTVTGRSNLDQRIDTFEVLGMDGVYESNNSTTSFREITIKYKIEDKTNEGLRERYNRLNSLLSGEKKPIVFTDEDVFFYATLQTHDVPEEETNKLVATITFLCSDPYKYGQEKTDAFTNDVLSVTTEGTAPSLPIFEMEATKQATFAMIQNQNQEYMMVGRPIDVDDFVIAERELILHDSMASTVGWTDGTQLDNGTVSGSMSSSGSAFVVSSWGAAEGEAKWYGPALKKSLSEQLQDFQIDIRVQNMDEANQVGRVEMYLLDVNDNIIGRITLKDAWTDYSRNRGEARAGNASNGHYLLDESYAGSWHDFRGMLRLKRQGNEWTSYIAKIDEEGTHRSRETRRFTDTQNSYMDQVAQIQISIAKFGNYEATNANIYDLKVWKLNDPDANQIPYIVDPGDVVTFDHKNKVILINGEPRKDLKDFGASYFALNPGYNQLVTMPSDSFNTSVKYQERYK